MKDDSDYDKGFGLKEVVHLSVLGWSATILTAGYLNIIKADPTFVASSIALQPLLARLKEAPCQHVQLVCDLSRTCWARLRVNTAHP